MQDTSDSAPDDSATDVARNDSCSATDVARRTSLDSATSVAPKNFTSYVYSRFRAFDDALLGATPIIRVINGIQIVGLFIISPDKKQFFMQSIFGGVFGCLIVYYIISPKKIFTRGSILGLGLCVLIAYYRLFCRGYLKT